MKDLVKAADGSVEGLKQLLKQEWELPEDTRVAVYVSQLYLVANYYGKIVLHTHTPISNTLVLESAGMVWTMTAQSLSSLQWLHTI